MSGVRVIVHPDADAVAAGVAARLLTVLQDATATGTAHVALTGGTAGIAALAAIGESPLVAAVAWDRVHLWWGDERYVGAADGDRNETQAREALLDHPALTGVHLHPMPAADGPDGDDLAAAARRHATELATHATPGAALAAPPFDVVLLGLGPDGHIASLFPEHPHVFDRSETCVAVTDSPKPPPLRLSLTVPVLQSAAQVWLVVAGEGKAEALAAAVNDDTDPALTPGVLARGRTLTLALVDEAAASRIRPLRD